jgi:hypothetical protein
MTDELKFTSGERDALTLWSRVGSPGPPPAEPYIPSRGDRSDHSTSIRDPATIEINWSLDESGFEALRVGDYADAVEDKWDTYFGEFWPHRRANRRLTAVLPSDRRARVDRELDHGRWRRRPDA